MKVDEKQFVDFETACQLNKLGFKETCFAVYVLSDGELTIVGNSDEVVIRTPTVLAPLYQQVIDWLRDKEIFVEISTNSFGHFFYRVRQFNKNHKLQSANIKGSYNYHELQNLAIKKALKFLKNKIIE